MEHEVFNITIGGHDEKEPKDPDDEGSTYQQTHSSYKVQEVSPDDTIKSEKYIVFTGILMSLLTAVHGNMCKRQRCICVLDYCKIYVGTCLVVTWKCNAGHFGGRWAAQLMCNQVRADNLTLASFLLFSGNSLKS